MNFSDLSYVRCLICGWFTEIGELTATELAAGHIAVCEYARQVPLMAPMWSIAHPWYWSDAAEAYRAGTGPQPPYGIEIALRSVGSHSFASPFGIGSSIKTWHLFLALQEPVATG